MQNSAADFFEETKVLFSLTCAIYYKDPKCLLPLHFPPGLYQVGFIKRDKLTQQNREITPNAELLGAYPCPIHQLLRVTAACMASARWGTVLELKPAMLILLCTIKQDVQLNLK